jgi:hypothetical protein
MERLGARPCKMYKGKGEDRVGEIVAEETQKKKAGDPMESWTKRFSF